MQNITFINAGAGSGKTYSLTGQLVDNISSGKCNADQVILTTFTKLAANEFEGKTREALLKKGLTEQANLLASAAMGTVHSVALQLIKRYWYLLGSGVEIDIMAQEDVSFFVNQSLANIPTETELEDLMELTRELGFVTGFNMPDEDRWRADLLEVINMALSNRIEDIEDSRNASLAEIEELYNPIELDIDENSLRNSLKTALRESRNLKQSDANDKRIRKLEDLLKKRQFSIQDYLEIRAFLTRKGNLPQTILNLGEVKGAIESLSLVHRSEYLVDKIRNYVRIIFDIASRSINEFREYKQRNNVIDYTDMEVSFLELLGKEQIREELSSKYKMIFVDEFQDSSPMQLQIFIKLSEIVNHSFWVGDPKQAIYAFRGTDPQLVQALVKVISEDEMNENPNQLFLENLPDSWRSRPDIVNLCSNIFTRALADQVVDPRQIGLTPVRDDQGFGENNDQPAVQHWHIDDSQRAKKERLHHHLASTMADMINDRGIQVTDRSRSRITNSEGEEDHVELKDLAPGDVGILCRTHKSVNSLAESLSGFGFQVVAQRPGLKIAAEFQLMLALMNYMLDDSDSLAKATILLLGGENTSPGRLLDKRLAFLNDEGVPKRPDKHDFEEDDEGYRIARESYYTWLKSWGMDEDLMERAAELRQRVHGLSVSALVEKIIHELALSDIVRRWGKPIQRSGNLQAIINQSVKYTDRCQVMKLPVSLQGFLEYLRQFDEDDLKQSAQTRGNAINILTYHGSKGLEYPVVVLTDLDTNYLDDNHLIRYSFFGCSLDASTPVNLENPFEGKLIILNPWPFGGQKSVYDDLKNDILAIPRFSRIRIKEEGETKRLLYVGMTRARDILVTTSFKKQSPVWLNLVLGHEKLMENIGKAEHNSPDDLFGAGAPVTLFKYDFGVDESYPELTAGQVQVVTKSGPADQNDPRFISPSYAEPVQGCEVSVLANIESRITVNGGLAEREDVLGNCLHDIFYMYQAGIDKDSFIPLAERIIKNHDLTAFLPDTGSIYTSVAGLFGILEEKHGTPLRIYKELSLRHERDGYVLRGEADLVWETDQGIVLIDYKSYPGRINHINTPAHVKYSGRYSGQLNMYSEMIEATHPQGKRVDHTYIWYSVLGALVELRF